MSVRHCESLSASPPQGHGLWLNNNIIYKVLCICTVKTITVRACHGSDQITKKRELWWSRKKNFFSNYSEVSHLLKINLYILNNRVTLVHQCPLFTIYSSKYSVLHFYLAFYKCTRAVVLTKAAAAQNVKIFFNPT